METEPWKATGLIYNLINFFEIRHNTPVYGYHNCYDIYFIDPSM